MRTKIAIIPCSPGASEYSRELERGLSRNGWDTWIEIRDVLVGDSVVRELDDALASALAVVLVGPIDSSLLYHRIAYAIQSKGVLRTGLSLVYAPSDAEPTPIGLGPFVAFLPVGLSPEEAAAAVGSVVVTPTVSFDGQMMDPSALRPGSWLAAKRIVNYEGHASAVRALLLVDQFEMARDLYWESLYASGYREEWSTRTTLSSDLLAAALARHDLTTAGLVTVKGLAYPLLETRNMRKASKLLREGARFLEEAHSRDGAGAVWSYWGDMARGMGDLDAAEAAYREGADLLTGSERHQIELKRRWNRISMGAGSAASVPALEELRHEFASIYDYREGLVSLDLGRALASAGDFDQAVAEADTGLQMLSQRAGMPRNVLRARRVVSALSAERARLRVIERQRQTRVTTGGVETPASARESSSIGAWLDAAASAGLSGPLAEIAQEETDKHRRLRRLAETIGLPVYDTREFTLPKEMSQSLAFAKSISVGDWCLAVRAEHEDVRRPSYRRLGLTFAQFADVVATWKSDRLRVVLTPYREPALSGTIWCDSGAMLLELVRGPHFWLTKSPPAPEVILRCTYGPLDPVVRHSTASASQRALLYRVLCDVVEATVGQSPRGCRESQPSFYAEFHWHRDVGYRFIECSFSGGWV